MMADQETDEPKKKGGLVKIIGLVLGGLLLVGVGLGAGFFMFGGMVLLQVLKLSRS
jgi:flagellar FliL protein